MKVPRTIWTTALVLLSVGPSAQQHDTAGSYLAESFDLTAAEIGRVNGGHVLSRTLEAGDRREVATVGVMRAKIPPEFYADRLADITSFKKTDDILQIGVFSQPPTVQDVAALTLEESDLRSLQQCRVGSCGVQLSAAAIDRFRTEVPWGKPEAHKEANALMRQILVDYVARYQAAGAKASMAYADQSNTLDLGREFASLAESGAEGLRQFPGLYRYLLEYPSQKTPETLDSIYWSKEKVGRRPVVSITHLSIRRTSDESSADYAIASKHIYGTHYFDASLGLTVLVRDNKSSTPATYVVYLNRSRVDMFGGLLGGITRRVVSARARSLVSDQLTRMQQTLEREFATDYSSRSATTGSTRVARQAGK